jgi:predicted esterase
MLDYQIIPARVADRPAGAGCWCLVLHGLGDSMEGWKPVAQLLGIDSLGYVFANAPDDYHGGYSWFDLSQDFIPDPGQIRRSRAALEELIGRLLGELGIPSEQLFLMGFSQGSLMCVDVALRSSHRFAGVIGISGFMALLEEFPAAFSSAGAPGRAAAHPWPFRSPDPHRLRPPTARPAARPGCDAGLARIPQGAHPRPHPRSRRHPRVHRRAWRGRAASPALNGGGEAASGASCPARLPP